MPTTDADPKVTATLRCPLCDTALDAAHPDECPKCDWVHESHPDHAASYTERDQYSLVLSVVPGLGHIYKGHLSLGVLFMAGGLVALAMVGLIATFTMGFGLLLLPLYWVAVMMHVFWLEDRRRTVAT